MFGIVIKVSAWDANNIESVKEYVGYIASKEGVNVQNALAVASCESRFNKDAWNKSDPNDGSKGIFQFQDKTFYGFSKKYNIESPDIWNPFQQINLAIYMMKDGLSYHWSCYNKLYGET